MLIAAVELVVALAACGAFAGLIVGSLAAPSPRVLSLLIAGFGAGAALVGLTAALVAQFRGGERPLYARGAFHGYVLGFPEMEFAVLTVLLAAGASVTIPFFLQPTHLGLLRRAVLAVMALSAVASCAWLARRARR